MATDYRKLAERGMEVSIARIPVGREFEGLCSGRLAKSRIRRKVN